MAAFICAVLFCNAPAVWKVRVRTYGTHFMCGDCLGATLQNKEREVMEISRIPE
jgi:hypothetical protein